MTTWLAALAWDRFFGEPPAPAHPVVWMGRLILWLESRAPTQREWRDPPPTALPRFADGSKSSTRRGELLYGTLIAAVPALGAAFVGLAVRRVRPRVLRTLLEVWLLKSTFSLRALLDAGDAVRDRLASGDLEGARASLRSLVARERATLDPAHVASAAVESAAENLADSYVAPLLWYAAFGLPAALAYRAVNTADAMVGYRGRYEYLGKASAQLDDCASYLPSRASALALVVAAPLVGSSAEGALRVLRRDRGLTASPNAGWPMAAVAGALGVWLEKPGHYHLGGGREPKAGDIATAGRLVLAAAGLCTLALAVVWNER